MISAGLMVGLTFEELSDEYFFEGWEDPYEKLEECGLSWGYLAEGDNIEDAIVGYYMPVEEYHTLYHTIDCSCPFEFTADLMEKVSLFEKETGFKPKLFSFVNHIHVSKTKEPWEL